MMSKRQHFYRWSVSLFLILMHQRQTTLCILESLDVLALVQRQAVRQPACLALCQNRLKKDGFVYLSLAQEELFWILRVSGCRIIVRQIQVLRMFIMQMDGITLMKFHLQKHLQRAIFQRDKMEAAIPSLIPMMLQQAWWMVLWLYFLVNLTMTMELQRRFALVKRLQTDAT